MSLKSVIIALILLSLTGSCFAARRAEERLRLYDLTCEYLKNPKGIDERQPRLGWKLRNRLWQAYMVSGSRLIVSLLHQAGSC